MNKSALLGVLLITTVLLAGCTGRKKPTTKQELQKETEQLQEETESQISCSMQQMQIFNTEVDTAAQEVSVALTNTGTVDISSVTITLTSGGQTVGEKTFPDANLKTGATVQKTVPYTQNPDTVSVKSANCPGIETSASVE